MALALRASPDVLRKQGFAVNRDGVRRSVADLLAYPGIDVGRLTSHWPQLAELPRWVAEQLEIDARYAGYLQRQEADIRSFRRDELLRLPPDLDYSLIGGLSNEARQKLTIARPVTIGAAERISGVTPAAIVALLRYVRLSPKAIAEAPPQNNAVQRT